MQHTFYNTPNPNPPLTPPHPKRKIKRKGKGKPHPDTHTHTPSQSHPQAMCTQNHECGSGLNSRMGVRRLTHVGPTWGSLFSLRIPVRELGPDPHSKITRKSSLSLPSHGKHMHKKNKKIKNLNIQKKSKKEIRGGHRPVRLALYKFKFKPV